MSRALRESSFVEWCRRNGGAKLTAPSLYPWLDSARSVACGWCDLDFAACRCFGSRPPAEPARPIDIAAFLESIPKWCRSCRGAQPCACGWPELRLTYQRRYHAKARTLGRCVRCTGPAHEDGGALCKACRAASRVYQKALRLGREAAGLCARCGAADHASGEHYTRIKQAIIDRGDCVTCGRDRGEGRRQCRPCRDRDAARHRGNGLHHLRHFGPGSTLGPDRPKWTASTRLRHRSASSALWPLLGRSRNPLHLGPRVLRTTEELLNLRRCRYGYRNSRH